MFDPTLSDFNLSLTLGEITVSKTERLDEFCPEQQRDTCFEHELVHHRLQ